MLATNVYIWGPATTGVAGEYTLSLYFQDSTKEKFLNIGDVVKDTALNEYEVISATLPFNSGGTLTVRALTTEVLPVQDSGYDSIIFTPGQIDFSTNVKTSGVISNANLYYGPDYEYEVSVTWNDSNAANDAVVGDRIVDSNGVVYEISHIDATYRFDSPCRVIEVDREGKTPKDGNGTLYRPASNYKFFQGTELTDPARTIVFNRDSAYLDHLLRDSYYTKTEVDDIIGSSGGTSLTLRRNQTPVETPDGTLDTFTLPNSESYNLGSLVVYVNGLQEFNISEISSTQFRINSAPLTGDNLRIEYELG